jgi:hypothetical protein
MLLLICETPFESSFTQPIKNLLIHSKIHIISSLSLGVTFDIWPEILENIINNVNIHLSDI